MQVWVSVFTFSTLSIEDIVLDTSISDEISYFEYLCCEMQALAVHGVRCDLFSRMAWVAWGHVFELTFSSLLFLFYRVAINKLKKYQRYQEPEHY